MSPKLVSLVDRYDNSKVFFFPCNISLAHVCIPLSPHAAGGDALDCRGMGEESIESTWSDSYSLGSLPLQFTTHMALASLSAKRHIAPCTHCSSLKGLPGWHIRCRGGSRIWSRGGPDCDRPKLPMVCSSVVQVKQALCQHGIWGLL